MAYEPKIESISSVLLSKAIHIAILSALSVFFAGLLALFLEKGDIGEAIINYIAILGFIEVALGAIFSLGVSEIAYASKTGQNPVYGETIMKDRLRYHTTQIVNGVNLILSGIILLLIGTFLS